MVRDLKYKIAFFDIPGNNGEDIDRFLEKNFKIKPENNFAFYKESIYKFFYSFSFVRNPFDRLVSIYDNNKEKMNGSSFEEFSMNLNDLKKIGVKDLDDHIRPQHIRICNIDGLILVNNVGKYEKRKDHIELIMNTHKMRKMCSKFPEYNINFENPLSNYKKYYKTEDQIDIVRNFYKKDLEIFGYEY